MGGGKSKKGTIGYKYYLGVHMVLCHGPIDSITKISVDYKTAWSGNSTGGWVFINARNLFGGTKREGGIKGTVNLDFGKSTQIRNTYLQAQLGSNVPAYRGVVSAVLRQVYVGMSNYIKIWRFKASRIHILTNGSPQWNPSTAAIGDDINPAHIIRECLTSNTWGMGYIDANVDESSFNTAATILKNEGMGMSIVWDRQTIIEDFIKEIVKHIDGSLYVDRVSGKFVLKLVRDNYTFSALPILDESNVTKIKGYSKPMLGELTTSVTAIYWSSTTAKNESVTAQDMALSRAQGATIGMTVQYPGFTKGALAAKVAARDLLALSSPIIGCTIHATRAISSMNIGDPFRLQWPEYGIMDVVMRVTQMAFGGINNNEIVITASQDVFSMASAVVSSPPDSLWEDPIHDPAPSPVRDYRSATYYDLARYGDPSYVQDLETMDSGFTVSVKESSPDALYAGLNVEDSLGYQYIENIDFCATANLGEDIGPTQTYFAIYAETRIGIVEIGKYVQLGNELMRVDNVDADFLTVGRGCLDTVPANHSADTVILFSETSLGSDGVKYAQGETVHVKMTPITGRGELDIDDAPADTVVIERRQSCPYNGQNVRLNGIAYPETLAGYVDLIVTWSHRDRLVQTTATLHDTTYGNIGPEAGTSYNVTLKDGSTVLATRTDITTTTVTFNTTEIGSHENLIIELYSVRDGINSYQTHVIHFEFLRSSMDSTTDFTYDETTGQTTFDMG